MSLMGLLVADPTNSTKFVPFTGRYHTVFYSSWVKMRFFCHFIWIDMGNNIHLQRNYMQAHRKMRMNSAYWWWRSSRLK